MPVRWTEFFLLFTLTAMTGGIFWWLPRMRRGGLYFAVTVPPEFRASEEGRATRRGFRLAVLAASLLTVVAEFIAAQRPPDRLLAFAPLLQIAGVGGAWIWAWARTRPHSCSQALVRSAPIDDEEPGWLWIVAALAPILLLLAAALHLASLYPGLPERYPVHWNASGIADRFAVKSWRSVFFGIIMGSSVLLAINVNVWMLLRWARRGPGGRKGFTNRLLEANLRMLTIVCWALGLLFAAISLVPILPKNLADGIFVGLLVFPLALIAVTVLPLMKLAEEPGSEGDQTPDECWKLGAIYFNTDDPALVVPKRDGLGYSMNFARPQAWVFLAGIFSLILGPLALTRGW